MSRAICNSPVRGHRGETTRKQQCPVHGHAALLARDFQTPLLARVPEGGGGPAEEEIEPEAVDEGERPHPLLSSMIDHGYAVDDDPDFEGGHLHYRSCTYLTPGGQEYLFSQEYGVGERDDFGDDGELLYPVKYRWQVEDSDGRTLMTKEAGDVGYALDDLIYAHTVEGADASAGRLAGSMGDRSAELPINLVELLDDEMAFDQLIWEREARALGVSADIVDVLEDEFLDNDGFSEDFLAIHRTMNPTAEH